MDSCLIRVDPQLSLSVEHLRYPENLVSQLALDVDFSEDGLVIAGMYHVKLSTILFYLKRIIFQVLASICCVKDFRRLRC